MKRQYVYVALFLLVSPFLGKAQLVTRFLQNDAFNYGEELTYRLRYSLYVNINIGEATLKVADKPALLGNKEHYHIVANGKSYKFYDAFMKVRDRYESYIDNKSFLPSIAVRVINEGNFHFEDFCVFDHYNKIAKNKKGEVNKIGIFTQDILSGIYLCRTFDYNKARPGDSFMVNIFIDDSTYLLGMKYLGKEKIKTSDGTAFRCIKLCPILIVDRVFKSKDDMILWVSDDKNKIPIKITSDIAVGALYVELFKYKGLRNPFEAKL
jgi:hypothetical protein